MREDVSCEVARLRAQLDCMLITVVRLDDTGRITHVNDAWRRFARENGADMATEVGIGQDYLAVCDASRDDTARSVAQGIRAIIAGAADSCVVSYCCHSPNQRRWFRMEARRPAEPDRAIVLTHTDVTSLYRAETRSQLQAFVAEAYTSRKSFLTSCRDLALATCEALEWDYMGVWMLHAPSWTLRCVDIWTRPGIDLHAFDRATCDASLGPDAGLPGRAWKSRCGVWVTDHTIDPTRAGSGRAPHWTIMPAAALAAGLLSGFAFPLKCDGDVLAVIEVYGRSRESPDDALLRILELSGAQLALAELRDRAEQRVEAARAEADSAREQLEAVLDCAPAVVLAVDRSGAIQFVSKVLPGQTKESVIGTSWLQHVSPTNRAQMSAALQTVLDGGAPRAFDVSVPAPNGTMLCYANYMGPMQNAGRITGAVLVSQDVTDLRRAQTALAESQRLVSIGTLAAGVAHEINTPLQFISDNVEFLRGATRDLLSLPAALARLCQSLADEPLGVESRRALAAANAAQERADLEYLSQEVPQALELCADGLTRATTIVRSLKVFSHPAQDSMVAADLNAAVMATLTVARNEYRYVADLETDLGDIPFVVCHVNQINQAVLNIVINASHALADFHHGTDRKGVISVRTFRDGDSVVIAIRDTAGGIPTDIRARIFEPFFTTKEVGRGTGQGLAIAWTTIKEVHGGELSVESTIGVGSEFFIRLPARGNAAS